MNTNLTITIDQLALAIFSEEYRHQRTRTDDTALAIRNACATAQRVAELAPDFGFDRARAEDIRDQARREHSERIADGVGKLAAFFAENGYAVAQQSTTPKHSVLTLACGAVINVWSTGTANVQGKPSDSDRAAIIELLRADGWKVKG